MKWVLIDNQGNVNTRAELHSGYGIKSAKAYFMGVKQIDESSFDKLWSVKSENEHNLNQEAFERPASSDPNRRWWKEEQDITNDDPVL